MKAAGGGARPGAEKGTDSGEPRGRTGPTCGPGRQQQERGRPDGRGAQQRQRRAPGHAAGRGAAGAPPPLPAARPLPPLPGATQDGPFRGARGPPPPRPRRGRGLRRTAGVGTRARASGRRDEREGRTAGAREAGSPARPPRWAERGRGGRPLPEGRAPAGVARGKLGPEAGAAAGSWDAPRSRPGAWGLRRGTLGRKGGTVGASGRTSLRGAGARGLVTSQ